MQLAEMLSLTQIMLRAVIFLGGAKRYVCLPIFRLGRQLPILPTRRSATGNRSTEIILTNLFDFIYLSENLFDFRCALTNSCSVVYVLCIYLFSVLTQWLREQLCRRYKWININKTTLYDCGGHFNMFDKALPLGNMLDEALTLQVTDQSYYDLWLDLRLLMVVARLR